MTMSPWCELYKFQLPRKGPTVDVLSQTFWHVFHYCKRSWPHRNFHKLSFCGFKGTFIVFIPEYPLYLKSRCGTLHFHTCMLLLPPSAPIVCQVVFYLLQTQSSLPIIGLILHVLQLYKAPVCMILNFMALQTHCGSIKKRHCGRHCVCSWYVSLFFPTAFHADSCFKRSHKQ